MVQTFLVTRALSRLSDRPMPCPTGRLARNRYRRGPALRYRQELLGQRDTALAPRPIHNACRRWQSAEFQQHLSEPGPLVEVDLDNFKCHGLGPRPADDGLDADGPHAVRKFYRQERSWSQVAVGASDSSPHIQLGHREAQVFAQI